MAKNIITSRDIKSTDKGNDLFSKQSSLAQNYKAVRGFTHTLCKPLMPEDCVVQTSEEVSPIKWHLAHTSWFFEKFLLERFVKDYKPYNPLYNYLFNSYYLQAGSRFPKARRGELSRPTLKEIYKYREHVDEKVLELIEGSDDRLIEEIYPVAEIGINHIQQHQELIVTDIKHIFYTNPLRPVYSAPKKYEAGTPVPLEWITYSEGIVNIGHSGKEFAFDNEMPSHRQFIEPFRLASRLVTNGEYLEFIEDGGYKRPELWLSEGVKYLEEKGWQAPLYWEKSEDGQWQMMTLSGMCNINPAEPVCHVSFFEADAYARWAGLRLPTEFEWENASSVLPLEGNFVENGLFHPAPAGHNETFITPMQMFGDVWEWTQSAYLPYHGYKAPEGAIGEYNGKFMSGQMVLRGGSCATSLWHIRRTYRNFFPPHTRWQFSGIRLAKDN